MTDCKILHYTDSIHYELEQTARLMRILTLQLFTQLGITISLDEYCALDTISINRKICQRDLAKLILKDRGIDELNSISIKIKSYMDNVTKKIAPEEVEKVQMILKHFRLDLEKIVEMNI